MKQIRHNVFETNSSSTHSISLYNGVIDQFLDADYLGNTSGDLHINLDTYDWEWKWVRSPYEKLQYLLTFVACVNYVNFTSWNPLDVDETLADRKNIMYEDFWFRDILYYVTKHSNFTNIIIDDLDGDIAFSSRSGSIYDLLNEAHCDSIEEFLFSSSVKLRQGNDNDNDPECDVKGWGY